MSAARIGKIRMKSGGAEVRVLHRADPNPRGANWRGEIIDHARRIGALGEPGSELVGFVVIGLFEDGKSSLGWRYDPDSTAIPRLLLPTYIAELIRRDIITAPEAEQMAVDVFNQGPIG